MTAGWGGAARMAYDVCLAVVLTNGTVVLIASGACSVVDVADIGDCPASVVIATACSVVETVGLCPVVMVVA